VTAPGAAAGRSLKEAVRARLKEVATSGKSLGLSLMGALAAQYVTHAVVQTARRVLVHMLLRRKEAAT
jgi:mannose/fructose/N-acetylgalactosamine-specific phosphotransferase system component IID